MLNFILNGTKVAQFSNLKRIRFTQSVDIAGAGGETRTPNIQIRSLTLYPVELRPQVENLSAERMGRAKGFEPSTTGITIQSSTN